MTRLDILYRRATDAQDEANERPEDLLLARAAQAAHRDVHYASIEEGRRRENQAKPRGDKP